MIRPLRTLALSAAAMVCAVAVGPVASAEAAPAPSAAAHHRADDTATDVFLGTVRNRLPRTARQPAQVYRLEATRVLGGDLNDGDLLTVTTTAKFRACPGARLRVAPAQRYLFSLEQDNGDFVADACSDVRRATKSKIRAAEQKIAKQEDEQQPDEPSQDPAPLPEVQFQTMPTDEPTALTRAAAPGIAVVIAALLGLVLVRRLGRPRR